MTTLIEMSYGLVVYVRYTNPKKAINFYIYIQVKKIRQCKIVCTNEKHKESASRLSALHCDLVTLIVDAHTCRQRLKAPQRGSCIYIYIPCTLLQATIIIVHKKI